MWLCQRLKYHFWSLYYLISSAEKFDACFSFINLRITHLFCKTNKRYNWALCDKTNRVAYAWAVKTQIIFTVSYMCSYKDPLYLQIDSKDSVKKILFLVADLNVCWLHTWLCLLCQTSMLAYIYCSTKV